MATIRRVYYTRPIPSNAVRVTVKDKPAIRFSGEDGKPVVAFLTKDEQRCRIPSTKWYGQYTDAGGLTKRVPLSEDKTVAQQMLNKLVRQVELEKVGIRDRFAEHRQRPLSEHMADWEGSLRANGRAEEYIKLKMTRVQTIVAGCEFKSMQDLSADRVELFLSDLRVKKGRCIQTSNDWLQAIRQFIHWLVANERLDRDPFVKLRKGNPERDRRHVRRVLDADELQTLIASTRQSGIARRGLSGEERAMLYAVAASTGYRAAELAALMPVCFNLMADRPSIDLDAKFTKNGKTAYQPIPTGLAAALRSFLADKPMGQRVWPGLWIDRPSALIQADAKLAGIPLTIETKDGEEVLDFHSLRGTFATLLDSADISLKARQELMRHSDPRLTLNRYTRAKLHDLGAAVDKLPSLMARATGYKGEPCPILALPGETESAQPNASVAVGGLQSGTCESTEPPVSQGFHDVCHSVAERAGFEPAVGFYPHAALAKRCFRPLSHLSKCLLSSRLLHFLASSASELYYQSNLCGRKVGPGGCDPPDRHHLTLLMQGDTWESLPVRARLEKPSPSQRSRTASSRSQRTLAASGRRKSASRFTPSARGQLALMRHATVIERSGGTSSRHSVRARRCVISCDRGIPASSVARLNNPGTRLFSSTSA